MRRGRNHAALRTVILQQMAQGFLRGGVEGRGRLVEEPEGAMGNEQAGERDPVALAGGEVAHRQFRGMDQSHGLQRVTRRQIRVAQKIARESQILLGRQRRFQRIAVSDVMQTFR